MGRGIHEGIEMIGNEDAMNWFIGVVLLCIIITVFYGGRRRDKHGDHQ